MKNLILAVPINSYIEM